MRLWSRPTTSLFTLLTAFSLTTTVTTATAKAVTLPTSGLLFSLPVLATSAAPVFASVAGNNIPANRRNFRLGKPAANLNLDRSSTMSSVTLPPQTETFEGFAQQPKIEPTPETAQLIKDAQDLFGAKPSPTIFSRSWAPTAIFADPICHANGAKQYLAQWYGMPAAFAESETLEWKLTKQEPREVQYVQKQRYKVKGLGMEKVMISTVLMERDENNKITRFEDRWNHKPLGGALGWPFRRLNAVTMPWLVGVPKETKQAVGHDSL